ncbi:MAG: DUF262 domain-containing protein [Chloroflexota bacterium]
MNTTLFTEVSCPLSQLIHNIDSGEIGLPDIQRPFVWTPAKVRDLFDSMYRGFPVGYLIFWANGAADGARLIGTGTKQRVPRLLIVDGQQRLTSLYAVLKREPVVGADYTPHRIQIAFRPRDARFEVLDAAIGRDPEFIPDISEIWAGEQTLLQFTRTFLRRLEQARQQRKLQPLAVADADAQAEAISRLALLQNYPFRALELSATVDEEQVAEVFVRINSKAVPLNQADFILTLMSVFWDEGRFELERFCRAARKPSQHGPSPYNHFIQPNPD